MDTAAHPKTRIYQGWFVVAGSLFAFMFASVIHTSFGLFVVPASTELNISRADANNWLIIAGLGSAILAPIAGRMADRISVRLLMAIGGVIMALSMIGIAITHSPWVMLALAVPIAFAADSAGGIAANTVTARWFRRRRGRALAIVGISASAAGFFLAPVIAYLIVNFGWRGALPILGILCGVVIVLMTVLFIRNAPTAEQLLESGELTTDAEEKPGSVERRAWTFRQLLTDRNFLCLSFGIGLLFASDRALMISVAPYLSDLGVDLQKAALLISALTGSSIVGKLVVGYIADYVDPRKIFLVVAVLHIALLAMFILHPSYWTMFAIALGVGIGIGGVLPVSQVLTAKIFGSASYGTVIGAAAVINQIIMMASFRFVGEVRDRTGTYDLAFQIFIGFVLASALLVWLTKRPSEGQTLGAEGDTQRA